MQKSTVAILILLLLLVNIGSVLLLNFLFPEFGSLLQSAYDFIIAAVFSVIAAIVLKNYRSTGVFAINCAAICYLLGHTYLLLHILIRGFSSETVFSISDVSYIGVYLFNAAFAAFLFFTTKTSQKMNRKALVFSVLGISCFAGIMIFGILAGYFIPFSTIIYGAAAVLALIFTCLALIRLPRKKPFMYFLFLMIGSIIILLAYFVLYGINIPFTNSIYVFVELAQTSLIILCIPMLFAFRNELRRVGARTIKEQERN